MAVWCLGDHHQCWVFRDRTEDYITIETSAARRESVGSYNARRYFDFEFVGESAFMDGITDGELDTVRPNHCIVGCLKKDTVFTVG